jgi:hypothetical protein
LKGQSASNFKLSSHGGVASERPLDQLVNLASLRRCVFKKPTRSSGFASTSLKSPHNRAIGVAVLEKPKVIPVSVNVVRTRVIVVHAKFMLDRGGGAMVESPRALARFHQLR